MLFRLLFLLLIVANVALASGVFVSLARPDVAIRFGLRYGGMGEAWFQEYVTDEELGRLRALVKVGSAVGLVAVFTLSFMVGALMGLGQV